MKAAALVGRSVANSSDDADQHQDDDEGERHAE
jgi:hypothetical protein